MLVAASDEKSGGGPNRRTATAGPLPSIMAGPVAIVTGAGSGVGEAVARGLAGAGYRLALVARTRSALERVADAIAPRDPRDVLVLDLDLAETENAARMVDRTIEHFGELRALINNAGVAPLLPIDKTPARTIRDAFDLNAVSPAIAIAHAWPHLARAGGVIVNVSSMATQDPFPGFFAYAASKAPLNLMARSCAKEGARSGIRAFAVAPGAIETPMLRRMFDERAIPPRKCLSPADVARVIVACVMGEHDDKSGQTILLPSP